jgi:hypothetical protein
MAGSAAIALTITLRGSDREQSELISDQVMAALLKMDRIEDPSVLTNLAAHQLEIEVIVSEVEDLAVAQEIGLAAIERALDAAGLTAATEERQRQSAELLPA